MVMSIGWNPYYKNERRSAVRLAPNEGTPHGISQLVEEINCSCSFQEVHIIHDFPEDFYGVAMRVLILAYVRPEQNYPSLGNGRQSCKITESLYCLQSLCYSIP
jgi:riboflavin kinase